MTRPVPLIFTALFACAVTISGIRAFTCRRFDSSLLHLGCACVLAGWLMGRIAERTSTPERPVIGSMALVDGDVSDKLWEGTTLNKPIGHIPFTVKLEKFSVEYYDANGQDRDEGRMPPVREYRSQVTITEPGKPSYAATVRVNHPVYVQGYNIYQMSWGQSKDVYGRPVTYTVLQFIRDPGLPVVYAGFAVLFAGILFFTARVLRGTVRPEMKEMPS